MNSEAIAKEIELVLLRFRAGLLSPDQAAKEQSILQVLLRAREQADLERKLDALRAALESRDAPVRGGGHG
jgi:hypothetical protein